MALTAQQQAFVTAYLDGGMSNASEAYRVAYPTSRKWTPKRVSEEVATMLSNPRIAPVIAAARAKAAARLVECEDRYAVSKERISRALSLIAFADARKFYTWTVGGVKLKDSLELTDDEAAAVQAVSHTVTKDGGTIRVQIGDKRQALMDLAKLHGYVVDRKDVRVIRHISELSEEELLALANTGRPAEDRGTRH